MMTTERKFLARTLFKLQVHSSEGFAFEKLFGSVMEYARLDFQKIEPYGNQGDRGNDGYQKADGRYFQVFAPKNPTESKSAAIKKVADDFQSKLLPYWGTFCTPKEYLFAFNDKYKGSIFDIEQTLAELKVKHSLAVCDVFLAKHLEQEFIGLDEDQICTIVGGLPTLEPIEGLDYSALGEVIQHIQNSPPPDFLAGKPVAPDIDDKIAFNGLTKNGPWLRAKTLETWQVDDYLQLNSTFAKQALRDSLSGYYKESLVEIPTTAGDQAVSVGDLRFAFILDRIAPRSENAVADRLRRDAALVLMAKYFEACDIFEEPLSVPS